MWNESKKYSFIREIVLGIDGSLTWFSWWITLSLLFFLCLFVLSSLPSSALLVSSLPKKGVWIELQNYINNNLHLFVCFGIFFWLFLVRHLTYYLFDIYSRFTLHSIYLFLLFSIFVVVGFLCLTFKSFAERDDLWPHLRRFTHKIKNT